MLQASGVADAVMNTTIWFRSDLVSLGVRRLRVHMVELVVQSIRSLRDVRSHYLLNLYTHLQRRDDHLSPRGLVLRQQINC